MAKRPSFQFYPGDWLRDTALRSCCVAARGLWMDMLCLMHEGQPYGHLKVADKVIDPPTLARMVGAALADTETWLGELDAAGVYSKKADGTMYSRRMIRDESLRRKRAAGGKLGGNPSLKVNHKDKPPSKNRPTPSSSSSSASASSSPVDKNTPPSAADYFEQAWKQYPKRPNNPKKAAMKAWNARIKEHALPVTMMVATVNYDVWVKREKTEPKYILMAQTFYGPAGRWEEFAKGVPGGGKSKKKISETDYDDMPEWAE